MKTITLQEAHKHLKECSSIVDVDSGDVIQHVVGDLFGAPNTSILFLFYTVDEENDTRVSFLERDNQLVKIIPQNGNMILVSDEGKEFEIALLKKQNLNRDAKKENICQKDLYKKVTEEFKAQRPEKPRIVIKNRGGNILFWSETAANFNVALEEALVTGTLLDYVNLAGHALDRVDFSRCYLRCAVFDNCKLVGANFKEANLSQSSFRNADLRGANFQDADLREADFDGALIAGANFYAAKSLEGVKNLPPEAIRRHDISPELHQIRDALMANLVFYTPIALRRRGGQWDEYELDAIHRNREALELINKIINSNKF